MTAHEWEEVPDQTTAPRGFTGPAVPSAWSGLAGGVGNQAFARMVSGAPRARGGRR